jgi:hypothetical protein
MIVGGVFYVFVVVLPVLEICLGECIKDEKEDIQKPARNKRVM